VESGPGIQRHASGSPYEPIVGYSRTVVAGPFVFVAGTTGTLDGQVLAEGDAYAQTVQALHNVERALAVAGARMSDVVQTQLFVTDISRWDEVGRAHAEAFAGYPPVTAMLGVTALIDPAMLVEIQAVAYLPSSTGRARAE